MPFVYCNDHFVNITFRGLGVDSSTWRVTSTAIMSAVSLLMVALSVEGFGQRAAIGFHAPRLENRHSFEALTDTDESKLTAMECTSSEFIRFLPKDCLDFFACPVSTTFGPLNGNPRLHLTCLLYDTLQAAPQLTEETQMSFHASPCFCASLAVDALPGASTRTRNAEPYKRSLSEDTKDSDDGIYNGVQGEIVGLCNSKAEAVVSDI